MKLALASVLVFSLALTVFASQSEQDEKDVSQQDQRSVRAAVDVKQALGSQGGVSRRTRNAGPDKERRKKKGGKKRKAKKGKKRGGKKRASKGKQKKRKAGKGKKRKHRSGKRKRTKGKKKTGKARFKSGNAKGRRLKQGGSRASSTRQGGAVYTGSACEYVSVTRLQASGSGCVHGTKFVIKPGTGTRRQFLNMDGEAIIGFVQQGTKFADCATNGGFKDVTGSINCKEVDGLAVAHLNQTGSGGSATTAGPGGSTTAAPPNAKCGLKKSSTKIIGGVETEVNEYPWFAALSFSSDGNPDAYFCAASLVSDSWLVTAAHCVEDLFVGMFTVVLGEHDRNAPTAIRQVFEASSIIIHPDYVWVELHNDIALIKLSEKVDLATFSPLCLPPADVDMAGVNAITYGLGTTDIYTQEVADVLMEVQVEIATHTQCQNVMGQYFDITKQQICAGGQADKDSCQGDSGGPLSAPLFGSNQEFLIGIVSAGISCGVEGLYGIYSNVTSLMPWVQETIIQYGGGGDIFI